MKKLLGMIAAIALVGSLAAPASAHDWTYRGANATSVSQTGTAGGTVAGAGTIGNGLAGAESYDGQLAVNEGYGSGLANNHNALAESGNMSQFESASSGGSFSLGNGAAAALGGGLGEAGGFSGADAWTSFGDD